MATTWYATTAPYASNIFTFGNGSSTVYSYTSTSNSPVVYKWYNRVMIDRKKKETHSFIFLLFYKGMMIIRSQRLWCQIMNTLQPLKQEPLSMNIFYYLYIFN